MTNEKMQMVVRLLLEDRLGCLPVGNLVIIAEDAEMNVHIISNAPNREMVEEYLKSLLNSKNKMDNIEGKAVN